MFFFFFYKKDAFFRQRLFVFIVIFNISLAIWFLQILK